MKYCICFSRVSTLSQMLESQSVELSKEAERLGYPISQQIQIEYKESAIQLSIDERKGIQELKERVESNKDIDCVIVFEISRLSRQTTMLFELRDWLIEHQIQLVCIKPYFRLLEDGKLSQTASIVFSLMTSLSESEMVIKKERMLRGRHFKREQNRYIGGRILLGYKVGTDDKIEIDYDDAETVRKIYRWYAEGKSMVWIARELEERGLVSGRWNGITNIIPSVASVLKRHEYTGRKCHTYNYPRIISDDVFNKVQEKITKNKAKYITHKKYLGQGLIREVTTGLMLTPNSRNYSALHIEKRAPITLNTNIIESWLWKICSERAKTITQDKLHQTYLHDVSVLNNKIHTNKIQIEQLHDKIDRINERIINNKMSEAKGDAMIRDIEQEINHLNNMHDLLTTKLINLKPNEVDMSDPKAVVRNEIDIIYASAIENDGKYKQKKLEVHFKDSTIETYIYRQKSQRVFITLNGNVVVENEKVNIIENFTWWYNKLHPTEDA